MQAIDELLRIYDLKEFKTYEQIMKTAEKLLRGSVSRELRFRMMDDARIMEGREEYYDCLALKAECSPTSIPGLSGAEGFRHAGSGGAEAMSGILERETKKPSDIRISKVVSHENLYWVFVNE